MASGQSSQSLKSVRPYASHVTRTLHTLRLGHVVCLVLKGNEWLVGWNSSKTAPQYGRSTPDGQRKHGRHAEQHALQLAERRGGKVKEVIVLRWTKTGELKMARPCVACQEALRQAGIKPRLVWYSTDDGRLERLG